jgi:hypothetical protein
MKTYFLIGIFLIYFSTNAQRIVIHVTEVIYMSGFDSTIADLLKNDSTEQIIKEVNSTYDLDLTKKSIMFYANNQLDYEGELTFQKTGDFIEVNFLIEGYNIGMTINTSLFNEQVIWHSDDIIKEIYKFTKFEIVKAS